MIEVNAWMWGGFNLFVGLMLALGSYIAPRLYHEKSKPKLQRIKEKLLSLFSNGRK